MENAIKKAVELRERAAFILGKRYVLEKINKIIDDYCSSDMATEEALSKIVEYLNREEIESYVSKNTK